MVCCEDACSCSSSPISDEAKKSSNEINHSADCHSSDDEHSVVALIFEAIKINMQVQYYIQFPITIYHTTIICLLFVPCMFELFV